MNHAGLFVGQAFLPVPLSLGSRGLDETADRQECLSYYRPTPLRPLRRHQLRPQPAAHVLEAP